MGILDNKKIIIMGVANKSSLAFGCMQAILNQGGQVILTYQNDRMKRSLDRFVDESVLKVECDVSTPENIQIAFKKIVDKVGKVDGIVHAIAYAEKSDLANKLTDSTLESFTTAQNISVYSFIATAKYGYDIMNNGGSIVTLSYMGSERAIPNYNIMGVAKAGLESSVRYLARDLAENNIRVNAISAGAIKTLAVTGVKNHNGLIQMSDERTVDGVGVTIEEVGNTAAFLLSPIASGVVGDIIYVDKGTHLI
ncbi:enoyl-[acyl-carrier-protein] reductase [NADH] [Leuconostoc litchii]|uniref:Enoyl-[acyl-carrier-protein] reductase [NADH] n=1 Tax=Leuconostoc litchii TaxID=1981069 RepID=A0A6P2CS01_9LACO|nr:enoyl-ACP reductase FabI [Leuconostoc litchii]TYC47009.1 enoyl-[acyl-carrier-protein] reductase FabI [Leuconostoc litchii]GMA68927.1 enoyl-[acyl-carrier-protein] reductase [NADH] [Leuconostoc litchii]